MASLTLFAGLVLVLETSRFVIGPGTRLAVNWPVETVSIVTSFESITLYVVIEYPFGAGSTYPGFFTFLKKMVFEVSFAHSEAPPHH